MCFSFLKRFVLVLFMMVMGVKLGGERRSGAQWGTSACLLAKASPCRQFASFVFQNVLHISFFFLDWYWYWCTVGDLSLPCYLAWCLQFASFDCQNLFVYPSFSLIDIGLILEGPANSLLSWLCRCCFIIFPKCNTMLSHLWQQMWYATFTYLYMFCNIFHFGRWTVIWYALGAARFIEQQRVCSRWLFTSLTFSTRALTSTSSQQANDQASLPSPFTLWTTSWGREWW